MKIKWDSKYTTISIYAFIVIAFSIVFYLLASEIDAFRLKINDTLSTFMPFIIGFVMAYLFNFILKFYENSILNIPVLNKKKGKFKRIAGLLLTYGTVSIIFYLFFNFIFPQLVSSIVGLANDIPIYISNITKLVNDFNSKYEIQEEYYNLVIEQWNKYKDSIIRFATNLIPILGNTVKVIIASIWNIVLGIIVSIYLLVDKERFLGLSRKMTRAIFSEKRADRIMQLTHRSNNIFGKFLSGKILDSLIISALTFVVLTIVNMPYTVLVSFIVGITNIIPFFGPFIGAIPSAFIIVFVSPIKALWFIIIILIIQQIDGNIIGPKILGDSLGIAPFWILFALLVGGKIFGFIGLIIGVPLFVFVYSLIKDITEEELKRKGLPYETDEYIK
ncbi:MAG: AI-2E family transporter [Tissierellaceae bacterium]|nr:AI-2E family transporter [Tissierellaceae bacterium]